ncbi:thiol:disulfide interchange protein DsbA/DsbL [Ectothiorhodospiraceae bacterium WFHF3C12]|nr:thiol:disulfide interchange protein DsbA/DsbL [Ectothiorhodospiraceae bacterium WFHF3C12]
MTRILAACLSLALFALAAPAGAAPFEAGNDYQVLGTAQPTDVKEGQVELREFFSYGCPHCFTFRPKLHEYMENGAPEAAELIRVPVTFGRQQWATLAKAYYAAQEMEVLDTMHEAIFKAIHVDNQPMSSVENLKALADANGVDGEDFAKRVNASMLVDMKTRRAEQAVRSYGVRSTPTVVVAGKYLVSPRSAGGHDRMLQVIDYLAQRELEGQQ